MELSKGQQRALDDALEGKSLFITGAGGVGKSHLVHTIKAELERLGKRVALTSSTGISAMNIGGSTIHSFCMTGLRSRIEELRSVSPEAIAKFRNYNSSIDVVIVDEVSMLSGDYIDMMDAWFQRMWKKPIAFGGRQMIFVGDFLQLPPVITKEDTVDYHFAFDSDSWLRYDIKEHFLTKVFRQEDKQTQYYLNCVRFGKINDKVLEYFNSRVGAELDDPEPTELYPLKASVADVNFKRLEKLEGEEFEYEAIFDGDEKWQAAIAKNTIAEVVVYLKVGASVLFIRNNAEAGYFNGMKGIVKECHEGYVVVETLDGRILEVNPETWEKKGNNGDTLATMKQIPLILGWSITIHKCVSKDTLLFTDRGLKTIDSFDKKIAPGFVKNKNINVMTRKGIKTTDQLFFGGKEKTIKITTKRGYEIECSERHPLLSWKDGIRQFVKSPEFKIGDSLVLSCDNLTAKENVSFSDYTGRNDYNGRCKDVKIPNHMTEDFGWVIGLLVGDGSYNYNKDYGRIDFTNVDVDIISKYKSCIKDIFNCDVKTTKDGKTHYFNSVLVRNFLEWLGLKFTTSCYKVCPDIILGNYNAHSSFLRGLFDADGGSHNSRYVHFTTTSVKLSKQVHIMLLSCGVVSRRYEMRKGVYRVDIQGYYCKKYFDNIGFFCGRKNKNIYEDTGVPKFNVGFVPNGRDILDDIHDMVLNKEGKKYGNEFRLPGNISRKWRVWLKNCKRPTYEQIKEFLLHYKKEYLWESKFYDDMYDCIKGCFVDDIIKIEYSENDVYDVHVPDGHEFIGNGFVNHNSQGMTLENMVCDLSLCFESGQAYVALSRMKSIEGLSIKKKIRRSCIKTNKKVIKYYRGLLTRMKEGKVERCAR